MKILQRLIYTHKRRKKVMSMKSPIMNACKTVRRIKYQKPTKRRVECVEITRDHRYKYVTIPIQYTPTSALYRKIISAIVEVGIE